MHTVFVMCRLVVLLLSSHTRQLSCPCCMPQETKAECDMDNSPHSFYIQGSKALQWLE